MDKINAFWHSLGRRRTDGNLGHIIYESRKSYVESLKGAVHQMERWLLESQKHTIMLRKFKEQRLSKS